jgi:hypothetical protein
MRDQDNGNGDVLVTEELLNRFKQPPAIGPPNTG